ncbi:hypothetical protein F4679DRAFT_581309 [Xylaria curta]|nr:hypothetical protein F4679DRAFT_581309 [Xylaria curta]
MPFSALLPEMVYQIILYAVKVRGIKRAVLDGHESGCPYLQRYFAQRIMGRPQTLCSRLRVIRQVAARIVSHRSKGRDDGDSYDAFRDCVFDLCRLCATWIGFGKIPQDDRWFVDAKPSTRPVNEHGEWFLQALLAAAAWINEVALVHEILPFFRESPHMIGHIDGKTRFLRPVFGHPIEMSAYRGNNEIMNLLLDAVVKNSCQDSYRCALENALETALLGNQLSTVELLILEPELDWESHYHSRPHDCLIKTADINVFKRLVPIVSERNYWDHFRWVCDAARDGNLAILKHLIEEEGAKLKEWYKAPYAGPVEGAAKNGWIDVLVYLLHKGFHKRPDTPWFAARSRNPDVMRIIIEGNTQQNSNLELGSALITATERENEQVVRLLLRCKHVRIDEKYKARARQRAEEWGLESMAEMLVC